MPLCSVTRTGDGQTLAINRLIAVDIRFLIFDVESRSATAQRSVVPSARWLSQEAADLLFCLTAAQVKAAVRERKRQLSAERAAIAD